MDNKNDDEEEELKGERQPDVTKINRKSREKIISLLTEEEKQERQPSGDYSSEGLFDPFRKAKIFVPTEIDAYYVTTKNGVDWYATQFYVGFMPPEGQMIKWSRISINFQPPVNKLGAWCPNDKFSNYKKIHTTSKVDVEVKVPKNVLTDKIPYIGELLPQLSLEYQRYQESTITPQDSVIRAVTNGQRILVYDLYEDPQTRIDPRQLKCQLLFGLPNAVSSLPNPTSLLELVANCRCGTLSPLSDITQGVDLFLQNYTTT